MNYPLEVEELLNIKLLINEQTVLVKELPVEDQIDYLIDEHFDVFRSDVFKTWRVQNCYSVSNKDSQKVLFSFNKAQQHFVENVLLKGFRKVIVLKSRQLGFTTLVAIWFLDEVIFNPNKNALQVAHTQKDGSELFNNKVAYAVRNLCPAMLNLLDIQQNRANKVQFSYPDGSTSSLSVSNSGRSGTYSLLHLSELAKLSKLYPQRADEVVTGTLPAVPATNSLVIIESTAEGVVGLFYEKYMTAYKRRDKITPQHTVAEFYPVFYNWTWDVEQIEKTCSQGIIRVDQMEESEIDWASYQKEYNLSDKEMTFYYTKWIGAERDVNKLNQEFPTTEMDAFISTGANFFSTKKIFKELEKLQETEPEYKTYDWNGAAFVETEKTYSDKFEGLIIFTEPQPGKHYAVGGDVAEGLQTGDYSTAVVLGMDKQPKAVYKGHIEPDEYSKMVYALGVMYNKALMGVEFNKDGNWVNTELVRLQYPNMYLRTSFDDITQTMTRSYGWITNKQTRDIALGEFKSFFNSCADFPYKIILDEMVTFVRDKRGKPQAQHKAHDDIIMAAGIAYGMLAGKVESIKVETKSEFGKLLWH